MLLQLRQRAEGLNIEENQLNRRNWGKHRGEASLLQINSLWQCVVTVQQLLQHLYYQQC